MTLSFTNIKVLIIAVFAMLQGACTTPPNVDKAWTTRSFNSSQEIIALYDSLSQAIGSGNSTLHTQNMCHYVWNSGEYIFRCRGKNSDIDELPHRIEKLLFDDSIVSNFMLARDTARFADHYMTLDAMQKGATFEEARDGITVTVFYRAKGTNNHDYNKLRTVFSCKNSALHEAYMRKLFFPFRNSGCSEELYSIRPLIEKNVADSPLRQQILALYDSYAPIMPGNPAPDATLFDSDGKEYTLSQYRGKVVVIDIWATWCSSCLAKMPAFIELSKEFENNNNVKFLAVSIDRKTAKKQWLATIKKRKMQEVTNLFPDCDAESPFESSYHISGVPRYMIIDKDGKIVSAYAPGPGEDMRKIILNTLNK